ncbi:O-antigen ligase family protein [Maricaulis parjimensis]|uniref:O-antigen ligase family protein n=1 Tax=Maricaulis parjimensis TaxID=144023 RepID=UPI00193AD9D8|nr:O-antigen ligase family protein [Maricaulis parjimensis]
MKPLLAWTTQQALAAYFLLIMLPLSALARYADTFRYSQVSTRFQIIGVVLFVGLGVLGSLKRFRRARLDTNYLLLWSGFCLWCLLSVTWSADPQKTLIYTILFAVIMTASALYWTRSPDVIRREMTQACLVILVLLAVLAVLLPIRARTFGWITPNLLAHFALVVMVFASTLTSRIRLAFFALALIVIGFTQSRTILISLFIFWCSLWLVVPFLRRVRNVTVPALLGLFVLLAGVMSFEPLVEIAQDVSSRALGVSDEGRLSGSGFTGRSDHWSNGLRLLQERELTGYGFRTRTEKSLIEGNVFSNAHSGAINLALDVGLLGLALYALIFVYTLVAYARRVALGRDGLDAAMFSFLLCYAPIFVSEPNYLSFAHPTSFLLILAFGGIFFHRQNTGPASLARASGVRGQAHLLRGAGRPAVPGASARSGPGRDRQTRP